MRPETVGRVLGIGLRVAGRVAGQRISAAAEPTGSTQVPATAATRPASSPSPGLRVNRQAGGSLVGGMRGLLRPFGRIGGTLWLEVTGVFFLLPVVVFVPTLWRTRFSWLSGPDHRTFVSAAIVVVVFFYLGVSSFWRAHRRSKLNAAPPSQ
jgi:hypothetical protein